MRSGIGAERVGRGFLTTMGLSRAAGPGLSTGPSLFWELDTLPPGPFASRQAPLNSPAGRPIISGNGHG